MEPNKKIKVVFKVFDRTCEEYFDIKSTAEDIKKKLNRISDTWVFLYQQEVDEKDIPKIIKHDVTEKDIEAGELRLEQIRSQTKR